MNEENKVNYYAIIPATVRYDKELKFAERLLYGEITALSNSCGFCYAKNRYFAELYDVTPGTVSKWIAHLQKLNYIKVALIRNEKQEIISRHIYVNDIPYSGNKLYPYSLFKPYPIDLNNKDNNINKIIDDLFILIINNSSKIPDEFYLTLNRLELLYTTDILSIMKPDKVQMLKEIIYTLYCIYNSEFKNLLTKIIREELINLYLISKEHPVDNFYNYYKKTIIKEYSKNNIRRI